MSWFLILFSLFSPAAEFEWSGELRSEGHFSAEELSSPTRTSDGIFYGLLEMDLKFNSFSRMHFKPTVRSNLSTREKPEQVFLNVQEAFWEIKTDLLNFKLGSNTYHWGILDGYSTMDITNGRLLFNPLSSEKRGAPSVHLSREFDSLQIQGLYIPQQARTLFPSADSRWLPRELLINASTPDQTILLPSSFRYYYPDYQEIDDALEHNFGVKMDLRHDDFDFSLMYFEGSSITPQAGILVTADIISINPDVVQARSDIGIIPIYFRQRTSAFSTVWTRETFVLKLESTYSKTTSGESILPPWSWQNGLALEIPWNFGETGATFLIQTYYGDNEDARDNLISSSSRLFDRAALLGARVSFSTETTMTASFLLNYRDQSSYIHWQMDHKWNSRLKSSLILDILSGEGDTLLGTYDKNDRALLTLSYLW